MVFPPSVVEALRKMGHVVGMTGDGVNDTPALKRADIGIAVEGATDAAKAAAAIVLVEPGLTVIIEVGSAFSPVHLDIMRPDVGWLPMICADCI